MKDFKYVQSRLQREEELDFPASICHSVDYVELEVPV